MWGLCNLPNKWTCFSLQCSERVGIEILVFNFLSFWLIFIPPPLTAHKFIKENYDLTFSFAKKVQSMHKSKYCYVPIADSFVIFSSSRCRLLLQENCQMNKKKNGSTALDQGFKFKNCKKKFFSFLFCFQEFLSLIPAGPWEKDIMTDRQQINYS